MSLGNFNSNVKKKSYSPITYSQFKLYNGESKVDPTCLNFAFWNGLMKISITPINQKSEESSPKLDREKSVDFYIGPNKAKMFLYYLKEFKTVQNKYNNVGIGTNKGILYLTNGKNEFGVESMFIVIKLIDFPNNKITAEAAYEFNTNIFGVTNFKNQNLEFDRNFDFAKFAEIDMLIDIMTSYINSASYAYAATVVDASKFDVSRINTKINSIQEKLGIDYKKNSYGTSQSYWDSDRSSGSSSNDYSTPEQYDNISQLVDDISSMVVED